MKPLWIKAIILWVIVPIVIYQGIFIPFKVPMLFAYLAFIIAYTTPAGSPYRAINALLAAEFFLSVGIDTVIWHKTGVFTSMAQANLFNMEFDLYKTTFNIIFYGVFFYTGGLLLAGLACVMALYHSARVFSYIFDAQLFLVIDYELVIWVFCILQLACALRGMLHGLENRLNLSDHRHHHPHSGIS